MPTLSDPSNELDAALEQALAAVEARARGQEPASPRPSVHPSEAPVDIELDVDDGPDAREPVPSAPVPTAHRVDETLLLRARLADANAATRRAEAEARTAAEQRAAAESRLAEAEKTHGILAADFERLRQRARKDAEDAERRGEERALHALLDTFDNVERARQHAADESGRLAEGLRMIADQLRRQVTRVGLERIDAQRGSPFDPEVHEALVHVPDDDVAEGCVVEELLAGFRLRGRLFRAARVSVAAARVTTPPSNG
jgi:molecular chaperone GrpE